MAASDESEPASQPAATLPTPGPDPAPATSPGVTRATVRERIARIDPATWLTRWGTVEARTRD